MPAPHPLTQCDLPDLDWSRPGTPAAQNFDDIYFSVDGGIEESRAVFLDGCDLPYTWLNSSYFSIGELGFGTGLNLLACWQLWDQFPQNKHLEFVSIEKFPLSLQQLTHALSYFPDIKPYADRLIKVWPGRVRGQHRLELSPSVTLTLIHDDVSPALDTLSHKFDAWFLDGFSPSKNPDMWSDSLMEKIATCSKPGTRLASFTVSGSVRNALRRAGFSVFKKEGFGRKRHRLEAIYDPPPYPLTHADNAPLAPFSPQTDTLSNTIPSAPLIIGGGIAGASICRAFLRAGLTPTLIDASNTLQTAASGNAAAIIKPRFDLQDRPESRFFLSSFLYARTTYLETGHILHHGVFHLAKDEKETARFEKLISQAPLGEDHLCLAQSGFHLPSALVIDPKPIIQNWTYGAVHIHAKVTKIEKTSKNGAHHYTLYDPDNREVASGDALILCVGAEIPVFEIDGLENLRFSRGQLSWAETHPPISAPVTYGGYALPLKQGTLIGATHARLSHNAPYALAHEDDLENFKKFERATAKTARAINRPSRVSIRVTTPNTLPCMKAVDANFWVLTGLGSRGFVFAPLLGVHIVSEIVGHVSALPPRQKACFLG